MKDFRFYVIHSHIIAYVPNNVVKNILTQPDLEGKREKWITFLLEYDLEIKPTKLVKGQGLAKFMIDSNCESLKINLLYNVSSGPDSILHVIKYFTNIKKEIREAPVLVSLDFSKDFIVFSFASEHTIAEVLLQKNQQNA